MSSRNQNKPPASPSPANKNQMDVTIAPSETEVSEWEVIEFTKEEVDDVAPNEKFKGNKFDSNEKNERMREYIKKLHVCIKLFQKDLEQELKSTIINLKNDIFSLKEESQKLDTIDRHNKEKEVTIALQKEKDSLKEQLFMLQQDLSTANDKVKEQEEMYKGIQEYDKSLQLYITKLQNELKTVKDVNIQVEKEKRVMLENHNTLREQFNFLQHEFNSTKVSLDREIKQKEEAKIEVNAFRVELQHVWVERESQISEIQELKSEIVKHKDSTGQTAEEFNKLRLKSTDLEKTCSTLRGHISVLQYQLGYANLKLKMADFSSSENGNKTKQIVPTLDG